MDKFKLTVQQRQGTTPNQLRRDGFVPATIYGPGQPSESVQVSEKEFTRLPAAAYSHMIELHADKGKPINAIIRNVQRRSTSNHVLNIEFYRVAMDRKLTMTVPLKFVGVSPAVLAGGQLLESFQEVDIECLPGDIPDFIEVDLSTIKEIDDAVHFEDLKISDKIKILNPLEEVIARVVAPRTQEEEAPAAAPAAEGAEAPAAEAAPAAS